MAKYTATAGLLFHGKWTDLATGETHVKRAIPKGTNFETDEELQGRHKALVKPYKTSGYSTKAAVEVPAGNGGPPKKGGK